VGLPMAMAQSAGGLNPDDVRWEISALGGMEHVSESTGPGRSLHKFTKAFTATADVQARQVWGQRLAVVTRRFFPSRPRASRFGFYAISRRTVMNNAS